MIVPPPTSDVLLSDLTISVSVPHVYHTRLLAPSGPLSASYGLDIVEQPCEANAVEHLISQNIPSTGLQHHQNGGFWEEDGYGYGGDEHEHELADHVQDERLASGPQLLVHHRQFIGLYSVAERSGLLPDMEQVSQVISIL